MKDFEHLPPDSIHPPRPQSQPTRRGAASLSRFGIEPRDGASDRNMAGIWGVFRALLNNPHLQIGRDNSEIIYPELPLMPRPIARGGSSSGSSSSDSSSSDPSSSAPSSSEESSSAPSSESDSEKSTAIVPMPWNAGGYGMMYCVESNQVIWTFVIWELPIRAARMVIPIDPRWLFVSEPGTMTVAGAPAGDRPFAVGAVVDGGNLVITVSKWRSRRPSKISLQLVSLRKGHAFRDMDDCTKEDFDKNEAFLHLAR